jgi:TM2 domain-containing membrane protein YozV
MPDQKKKSVALAYVLAVFLGPFGVHKFYLKQTRRGLAYLVLWVWAIAFVLGYLVSAPGNVSYAAGITYTLVYVRAGYTVLLLLFDLATLPRQVARANAPAVPTPGKRRWNMIGTAFIAIEMAVALIANIFFSWLGPTPTAP